MALTQDFAAEIETLTAQMQEALIAMVEDMREAMGRRSVGSRKAPTLDQVAEYLTIRNDEMAIREWLAARTALDGEAAAIVAWFWYEHDMQKALVEYGGPDGVSAALVARELPAMRRTLEQAREVMDAERVVIVPAEPWDGPVAWLARQGETVA